MNIIYSLFYWNQNGRYVFSRTKFVTIVTFLVCFVASLTTPPFLFPVIMGAVIAIPVFVVGFIIHKTVKIDSGFYEGDLISDIKHFLFYWHNSEFELSKTKFVTVAFILVGMLAGLSTVISGGSAGFAMAYNLISLFFAVPVFAVGFAYHKIKTRGNPQIETAKVSEPQIEKTAKPIEANIELPAKSTDHMAAINELKDEFDEKERNARELIRAKFAPPQITYDRFITVVDNCSKIFNEHYTSAVNLINFASEDSERVENEIESKINVLKSLIGKMDELSSELAISMSKTKDDDIHVVLDDMEDLISTIDDYDN